MAYYDFLNIVFSPLLKLPPLVAVVLMSFLISIVVILVTKFMTDQALMKKIKEELKDHQKQIKEFKNEPAKAMEVQKKAMELNMKCMSHSLKPTLITFIPIILIFGWMSATFAYESVHPNQEFSITATFDKNAQGVAILSVPKEITISGNKSQNIQNGQSTWKMKGVAGEHIIEVDYNNEKQDTSILITEGKWYINPIKKTEGSIKSIKINYKKQVVIPIGYKDWLGWLGTYIWSSIFFTMIIRKLLKVY